ncbi:substrate-binding periplasmic protein [Dongshaea marina]|uniref:substrate-binding periplasmic protein n=1 Tax=Dongshaea marina TaxID=2047966 RepID=UPI00131F35EB|nr:ABC transporter substrate-binding protein [Dongshaea marina]
MKYLLLICVIALLSSSPSQANNLDKLGYITEQYAPFNYVDEKGDTRGLAVDILRKVWGKLGVKQQDIRVLPWARGYYLTLQKPNTVLFSTTRIDSRESLFKWACPIAYLRVVLVAKKSADISLESLDDLSKYRLVAVRADVGEQMLLERGVDDTKIHLANQLDNAFKMLERDRMDLLSGGRLQFLAESRS